MKAKKFIFSLLSVMCCMPAFAGWQYDGYYVDDGYYNDDGSRFVVGIRGGLSFANAKIKNDIGSLYGYYYINESNNDVISSLAWEAAGEPSGYLYAGYGDLSTLPAKKDFAKLSFAAGASIGFTLANHPQWRLEAAYDYISETNYNQIPLFKGDLNVTGGDVGDVVISVASSGATASVSTDIISAMVFYDFFDGYKKQPEHFIPYIGVGFGYASSKTILKLADVYGDLSTDSDLQNYGKPDSDGVLQFNPPGDKTKYPTSDNIAVVGAVGASYGINEYTFLDFGVRAMYIPKITWDLVNNDGTLHREWFSAKDMIYTNVTVGLRFEF